MVVVVECVTNFCALHHSSSGLGAGHTSWPQFEGGVLTRYVSHCVLCVTPCVVCHTVCCVSHCVLCVLCLQLAQQLRMAKAQQQESVPTTEEEKKKRYKQKKVRLLVFGP